MHDGYLPLCYFIFLRMIFYPIRIVLAISFPLKPLFVPPVSLLLPLLPLLRFLTSTLRFIIYSTRYADLDKRF